MTVTVEASNDNGSSELEKVYLVKAPQTPVFTPAAGEYPVGTKNHILVTQRQQI